MGWCGAAPSCAVEEGNLDIWFIGSGRVTNSEIEADEQNEGEELAVLGGTGKRQIVGLEKHLVSTLDLIFLTEIGGTSSPKSFHCQWARRARRSWQFPPLEA